MANVQFYTLDPLGQSAIELGLEQITMRLVRLKNSPSNWMNSLKKLFWFS